MTDKTETPETLAEWIKDRLIVGEWQFPVETWVVNMAQRIRDSVENEKLIHGGCPVEHEELTQ